MNLNEISLGAESSHQHFCMLYPGLYLSMEAFSEYIIIIACLLCSSLSIFVLNAVKSIMENYFYGCCKMDSTKYLKYTDRSA